MFKKILGLSSLVLVTLSAAALAQPRIVLYADGGFRGDRLEFDAASPDLSLFRFNDRASSLEVQNGSWEICKDSHYRGCILLFDGGRGEMSDLSRIGWNDRVSSLRPVDVGAPAAGQGDNPGLQPQNYRFSGRGALALEGEEDHWFNKASLQLAANGTFELTVSTNRSQRFTGTYRWSGRERIEIEVTDGPGRGRGIVYMDGNTPRSVEIIGTFRRTGVYTFSFINQHYAPWND